MANISEIKVQGTNYSLRGFENLIQVSSLANLEPDNCYVANLSAASDISFKNVTSVGEHIRVIIIAQSKFELEWTSDVKSKYVFSNTSKIGFEPGDYALLDITCYPDNTFIFVNTNKFISELVYAEYTSSASESVKLFNLTSNIDYIIIEDTGEKITGFDGTFYNHTFNNSGSHKVMIKFKNTFVQDSGMFRDCPNLISMSEKFLDLNQNITTLTDTFWNSGLTSIPTGFLDKLTKLESVSGCFGNCKSLSSIPDNMFKSKLISNFSNAFYGCESLYSKYPIDEDGTPLFNRGLYKEGYVRANGNGCFTGCYKMENYDDVPKTWGGPKGHCHPMYADYGDILLNDGTCYIIDKLQVSNPQYEIPSDVCINAIGICLGGSNIYPDGCARFIYFGPKLEEFYNLNYDNALPWASSPDGIVAIDPNTNAEEVKLLLNGSELNNKIRQSPWKDKATAVNKCYSLDTIRGQHWYLPAAGEIGYSWDYQNPSTTPSQVVDNVAQKIIKARGLQNFYFSYGSWGNTAWTVNMYDNENSYHYIYRSPGMVYQTPLNDKNSSKYVYPMVKFGQNTSITGNKLASEAEPGDLLLKNGTVLSKNTYKTDYKDQVIGICFKSDTTILENANLFIYISKKYDRSAWSSQLLDCVGSPSIGSDHDPAGLEYTTSAISKPNLNEYYAFNRALRLGYVRGSISDLYDDGYFFLPSSSYFLGGLDGCLSADNIKAIKDTITHLNSVSGGGSFEDPFAVGNKFWLSMQNSDKSPYYLDLDADSPMGSQVVKGNYSDEYIILPMIAMDNSVGHGGVKDRLYLDCTNSLGGESSGYMNIKANGVIITGSSLALIPSNGVMEVKAPVGSALSAIVNDTGSGAISKVTINGQTMEANKEISLGPSYDGRRIPIKVGD